MQRLRAGGSVHVARTHAYRIAFAATAGSALAQTTSLAPASSARAANQEPGEKRTRLMLGVDLEETTMLGAGWYDVNRRVSFMVETYYAHNRAEITIRSGGIEQVHRLNADAWVLKTGSSTASGNPLPRRETQTAQQFGPGQSLAVAERETMLEF